MVYRANGGCCNIGVLFAYIPLLPLPTGYTSWSFGRCVVGVVWRMAIPTFTRVYREENLGEDAPEIATAHLFIFCEKSVEKI